MDAVASFDGDKMYLHMVNGLQDETVECSIRVAGFDFKGVKHRYLTSPSPDDRNTFEEPGKVVPRDGVRAESRNGEIILSLEPCSVHLLTLTR
ncbi:MAG: alpha-L-arabinofuranosidase C-terminal domain-containing protein [Nitrososphaerota archaeon]